MTVSYTHLDVYKRQILVLVTANNDSDFVHRGLLELRGDGFGYFLGGVGVDVVHAFLDGIERRILILVVTGAGRRFLSK